MAKREMGLRNLLYVVPRCACLALRRSENASYEGLILLRLACSSGGQRLRLAPVE